MSICPSLTKALLADGLPDSIEQIIFGMGCFWGVERLFWQQYGVYGTAVGYAGGDIANPSYEEVCTDLTGHAEVVLVAFEPSIITFEQLLTLFWENHNPTQGMKQGNDEGSQYRSVILCTTEQQLVQALASKKKYQQRLKVQGYRDITTEISMAPSFYFAEDYHQRYLQKNPNGYCGLKGTGISCSL